jgi:hypothetical protein
MLTRCALVATFFAALGVGYSIPSLLSSGASAQESGTDVASPDATADVSGPAPRVVVDETTFDFGEMALGEQQSHAFVINNAGDAPLALTPGETTCKCTLGTVEETLLPPGESTTVTLEWKPEAPARKFRQGATILTNDPRRPKLFFSVTGRVEDLFELIPEHTWELGQIDSSRETVVSGRIFSRVRDEFTIHEITSSDPGLLEGRFEPLPAEELQRHEAKCGYLLTAVLKPGLRPGAYRGSLTFKTDLGQELDPALLVEGFVPGAIRIIGPNWSPDQMHLRLGKFRASEGKRAALLIHILDREKFRDFKILEHFVDHPHLTLTVEEVTGTATDEHRALRLEFAVPPGAPDSLRPPENAVKVTLVTNDTELPEIELKVSFVTY